MRAKYPVSLTVAGGLCVVVALVAAGIVLTRESSSCAPGGGSLSAYEWRSSAWASPADAKDLISAAEALCLDSIYVDVTGLAVEQQHEDVERSLVNLLDVASESSVSVGALAGDPWWASDEGLADATLILQRLASVNAAGGTRIESVHLDVEPWGLDVWAEDKASLTGDYLEFVASIVNVRDGLDSSGLLLSFLIPYWFDGSNGEAPEVAHDAVMRFPFQHLDAGDYPDVAWIVMAYRDRAEGEGGVIDLLTEEVARSNTVGLALETAPVDPPSITFVDEEISDLDRELSKIRRADLGLVEIVINDFEHLRVLGDRAVIPDATPTG